MREPKKKKKKRKKKKRREETVKGEEKDKANKMRKEGE